MHAGFSLVELMIALALGLLLTQAIISIFLSSTRTFRTSEGVGQMQEQGRFATLLASPIIRQAGYVPDPINQQREPATVFNPTLGKGAILGFDNTAPALYSGVSAAEVAANTDVIAVAFLGRESTTDTPLKTCLGDPIAETQLAVNVFYVTKPDASGVSSLACYANLGTPTNDLATGVVRNEAIVPGVVDLQARYGLDTDADRVPNRYVVASDVADWTQVVSVQITFTVDSIAKAAAGSPNSAGVQDGRIRRAFSTTLQIRNRLS
jgi:type IV pilus assembly protein PilW